MPPMGHYSVGWAIPGPQRELHAVAIPQAPSRPPLPQPVQLPQAPPGLSFGELEARLKSSWECLVREGQACAEVDPEDTGASNPRISLACALDSTASRVPEVRRPPAVQETIPTLPLRLQPLSAFCKEGLFCPSCANRASCPFHLAEPTPAPAAGQVEPLPMKAQALEVPVKARATLPTACSSVCQMSIIGAGKLEDSEETPTESGSSEPWYGSSDGWSDWGDGFGRQEASATPVSSMVEDTKGAEFQAHEADEQLPQSGAAATQRSRAAPIDEWPAATAGSLQVLKKRPEATSKAVRPSRPGMAR